MARQLRRFAILAAAGIQVLGCAGEIAPGDSSGASGTGGGSNGNVSSAKAAGGSGGGTSGSNSMPVAPNRGMGAAAPVMPAKPAVGPVVGQPASDFAVPSSDILILPFAVRLQKVASVLGVPATDPLLNSLRDNRASLGDYDFANSVQPDKTWTALKIGDWVKAIKPVCASSQMRTRYPGLAENASSLIEAAYGRAATSDDLAALSGSAAGLSTAPSRYETICLALLSALEFVAQ